MRRELKKRGILHLTVVCSDELPIKPDYGDILPLDGKRNAPGSIAFVPSVAGLILAGEIIKDLTK